MFPTLRRLRFTLLPGLRRRIVDQKLHQGGCQCGAVRFEVSNTPKFISCCHCTSCRKATGAAFSTWVGFNASDFSWLGREPSYYESSTGVKRSFCTACGTPLTYQGEKWAGEIHALIGIFDQPEQFSPESEYAKEEALPWAKDLSIKPIKSV